MTAAESPVAVCYLLLAILLLVLACCQLCRLVRRICWLAAVRIRVLNVKLGISRRQKITDAITAEEGAVARARIVLQENP